MKPKNAPPATVRAPGFGRRQLLAGIPGLALLPLVPVGRLAAGESRAAQDLPDWVRTAREEIPAATASPYFQTGGIGPSPTPVIEQLADRLTFQNRSPAATQVAGVMGRIEPDLRAQLARVFGAGEDEVALTHSTSEGISIVAWSLDWRSGDEVVISNTEHPANVIPWY
ncbi:MAG: aminotransferase class V-fold PLP-dependent enzyme, partial [Acidobacteriota bacterium]|nr:aminotransferase class V-fold PLP-dependent enzyme [Acidobacteriota bacterium]